MKVKQLIKALQSFDANADVVLQKDPEGNGYSLLSGADHDAVFNKEEETVYDTRWSAADACMDEDEWRSVLRRKRCVVLFPER